MCKKHTPVSQSSTDSEINSLDATGRYHCSWCVVVEVLHSSNNIKSPTNIKVEKESWPECWSCCAHSLVARACFCAQRAHCVLRTSSRVSHTRIAQVSWKRCLLHMCHFSPSRILLSHDSLNLVVPWRSLRDHSRLRRHQVSHRHDLAVLSRPKSGGHAPLRICIAKFGYLAKSHANTDQLSNSDHVVTNATSSHCEAQLYIFEDHEAVIKMIIKGRSPMMRRVQNPQCRVRLVVGQNQLWPQDPNQICGHQKPPRWLVDWRQFLT